MVAGENAAPRGSTITISGLSRRAQVLDYRHPPATVVTLFSFPLGVSRPDVPQLTARAGGVSVGSRWRFRAGLRVA
jgi:hypothetical protein